MDGSEYNINAKPVTYRPLALKDCATELKLQALEHLLTAVYRRQVTLFSLLKEGGAPKAVLDYFSYIGYGSVAEKLIGDLRKTLGHSEKGERLFHIMERYYGLDGNMPARLKSIGTKYGVSRERIRQMKERCLTLFRGRKDALETALMKHAVRVAGISERHLEELKKESRAEASPGSRLLKQSEILMMNDDAAPFTFEQRRVLDLMDSAPRIMVAGCAGSGKTTLALCLTRKLLKSGKRTLLTCFNKGMAEFLTSQFSDEPQLVVMSFHALCLRLGRLAGVTIPGGWSSHVWIEKFPDVLRRAMLIDPSLRFDAIVVDDAQDFRNNWWATLEACLEDPLRGRMFCFIDDNLYFPSRMGHTPDVDLTARLSVNLRTPKSMASLLSSAYSAPANMRFLRESDHLPEFYRCDSKEEVLQTISHVVGDLIERLNYQASDIAILTPRAPRFSSALGASLRGKTRLVRRQSVLSNHALLARTQTFHGLERKVVIVVDLDEKFASSSPSELKNFVYTTFSRCTERLIILGCKGAWQSIESLHQKAHMDGVLSSQGMRERVRI